MTDHTIKGLTPSDINYDGSKLRVAIVHARWNKVIIDALVAGAVTKLKERGVPESNIVIQTVPGSFELPLACAKYVIYKIIWYTCQLTLSVESSKLGMYKLVQQQQTYWGDSVLQHHPSNPLGASPHVQALQPL